MSDTPIDLNATTPTARHYLQATHLRDPERLLSHSDGLRVDGDRAASEKG
jgi:hypothetical protein